MENKPFTLFIVEDNEWYNKLLVHTLSLNPDFLIESFFNGKDAIKQLSKKPDIVTVDYRLPDMDGETLLSQIKSFDPEIKVIVISEQEDVEVAVELLKSGATDYLVKTKDIKERLLNCVSQIRSHNALKKQVDRLQSEVKRKYNFSTSIIGESAAMKKVFDLINKALSTNITVSISGETGTGKEVVAKAIHYNSSSANKLFVAVNMAALPADLIESELFGHEKGAFTGALTRRIGKFEEADGGTLFLDEVGEMEMNFQAKLLRAIQEREIVRIGSNSTIKFNCRIIIATNRNLMDEVKAGRFREDLYYRLSGLPINLPALRERGSDILLLAKHYIDAFCKENNIEAKSLNESARKKLMSYQFPGNVRELKSIIELAVVMSTSQIIDAEDISLGDGDALPNVLSEEITLREYNQRIVKLYLNKYDNDTKLVAKKLDIGQTTVYRLLKESK